MVVLHSDFLCFTANYLVCPALFQVTTMEGRSSLGDASSCSVVLLVSDILSMQFINCDSVVLFCIFDIYHISVSPGREILLCGSFRGFIHLFFLPSKRFLSQHVFPHFNRGSKERGCCSLYSL